MSLLHFLDRTGTIAFAASEAWIAVKKQLDLFGVITPGMVTAVGSVIGIRILAIRLNWSLPPALSR